MTRLERYVGQILDDKYRLERLLGRGGMGAVYLATHLGTERYVALKLITPQFMRNEEFVERFKREARAAGRLRHPNVVDVTDFGFARADGERVAYLVMEYLDGCTLGDVLAEEKRLPLEWVVDILEQVCSAVHEAHLQGIVHRDLKPDNIWLEPNRLGGYRVKVLDFGIAKLAAAAVPSTAVTDSNPGLLATGNHNPSSSSSNNLETDTLIYDDGPPLSPNGDGSRVTQHYAAGTQLIDGSEAAGATVNIADDANDTQLFPTAGAGAATARARATDSPSDEDRTLMFNASTAHGSLERGTQIASTIEGSGLTRVGAIMGTPHYMSPEQCRSAQLDARSDIYSLGVIAFQMLDGELPFTGNTSAVITAHLENTPPALRDRNRKVPRRVSGVVMSAMEKDPAARPQTAAAFANSLRARADGIGALYRRAFALYSEYFPKFLKLSFLAHIPVIITTLTMVALIIAEQNLPKGISAAKIFVIVGMIITSLLQIAVYTVAVSTISGVTAIIVTQLQAAPLSPVELRKAFAVLRQRWKPFIKTVIQVTLRIFIGMCLGIIPGIVISIRYSLYAPVVLLEGLEKKAAMKRARQLASNSWRTVILVSLLQFVIPMCVSAMVGRLSINLHRVNGLPAARIHVQQVYQQLSGLINILVVPLISIVSALLYLKMRQFGGESLGTTLEQIEAVDSDKREWRRRMRSRLTLPTTHTSGHRSGG